MKQLCDFTIKFEQKLTQFRLYIIDKNDKQVPIDLGSGYQKIIISLALRTTFIKVTNKSLPSFLIIDEGFGCLDEDNLHNLIDIIPQFKYDHDFILMISHIDIIKNFIEYPLYININYIKKINGIDKIFSLLKYGKSTYAVAPTIEKISIRRCDIIQQITTGFRCAICGFTSNKKGMINRHVNYGSVKHRKELSKYQLIYDFIK